MGSFGQAVWNEGAQRAKDFAKPATDYAQSVVDRFKEGFSLEGTAGGTKAVGLGVKQTAGVARSTDGQTCVTNTTCLVIGPIIAGNVNAGVSVGTGTVTPGSKIWQLGAMGTGTAGAGGELGGMIGSDGSIEGGLEGTLGGGLGAGLLVCRK
jgi:hypothetical protein